MFNKVERMTKEDFRSLKNETFMVDGEVLTTYKISELHINGEFKGMYVPTTVTTSVEGSNKELVKVEDGDLDTCSVRQGDVISYAVNRVRNGCHTSWEKIKIISDDIVKPIEKIMEESKIYSFIGIISTNKLTTYDKVNVKKIIKKISIECEILEIKELGGIAYSVITKDMAEKEFKEKIKKEIKNMVG